MTRQVAAVGGVGHGVVFLTVTAPGSVKDRDAWNEASSRAFGQVVRTLRKAAPQLEYVRVLELQKRGLLHVHAILTGWRFVPAGLIRAVLMVNGFGARFDIAEVRSAEGVAGYVASHYLTKSRDDLGRRYRVVEYSRGWAPPEADPDAIIWRRAINAVDPVITLRQGQSAWAWAGDQEGAETLYEQRGDPFAYVREAVPRGVCPSCRGPSHALMTCGEAAAVMAEQEAGWG